MKHLLSSSAYLIVNKKLATKVGIKEAILLADLISKEQYFIDNKMTDDGWFFNTAKNIENDTTLSRHKQSVAIKNLIKKGFIKTKLKGLPASLHFKIIDIKILNFLNTGIKKSKDPDIQKVKANKNKEIIINKKDLLTRKGEFDEFVYSSGYTTEMCNDFIMYWTETNKSGSTMRFEMEKTFDIKRRLSRWAKNEKKWNGKGSKLNDQVDAFKRVNDMLKKL
tara:strand:- start:900 stop:1565 length:666 start_codon:yes stop_codon:yes gene_type:complete